MRTSACGEDRILDECSLLFALRKLVCEAVPISISPKFVDTWYIFTDDACEGDSKDLKVGGIDAVLVTPYGKYLPCFGRQLPGKWMKKNYMNTLILVQEAEVLPALV